MKLTKALNIIFLALCMSPQSIKAQSTGIIYLDDMIRIYNSLVSEEGHTFLVDVEAYNSWKDDSKPIEKQNLTYAILGKDQTYRHIADMEIVQAGGYNLQIDHSARRVIISKKQLSSENNWYTLNPLEFYLDNVDSVIILKPQAVYIRAYRFLLEDDGTPMIDLYFNTKTWLPEQIIYYLDEGNWLTSDIPGNRIKILMKYSPQPNHPAFNYKMFVLSTYAQKKNNEWKGIGKLATYEIIAFDE